MGTCTHIAVVFIVLPACAALELLTAPLLCCTGRFLAKTACSSQALPQAVHSLHACKDRELILPHARGLKCGAGAGSCAAAALGQCGAAPRRAGAPAGRRGACRCATLFAQGTCIGGCYTGVCWRQAAHAVHQSEICTCSRPRCHHHVPQSDRCCECMVKDWTGVSALHDNRAPAASPSFVLMDLSGPWPPSTIYLECMLSGCSHAGSGAGIRGSAGGRRIARQVAAGAVRHGALHAAGCGCAARAQRAAPAHRRQRLVLAVRPAEPRAHGHGQAPAQGAHSGSTRCSSNVQTAFFWLHGATTFQMSQKCK